MRRFLLVPLFFFCLLACFLSPIFGSNDNDKEPEDNYVIDVLLSLEDALDLMFPKSDTIVKENFILTAEEKLNIQKTLKRKIVEDSFEVFIGKKGDKIQGYTVISQEIGKFHPFTYAVCVKPDGKIKNTAIMVYRESRGGEISHKRFLAQYNGKSLDNPIKINKDIINITGATMSVRMMCMGVRKVLAVVDELYIKNRRDADSSSVLSLLINEINHQNQNSENNSVKGDRLAKMVMGSLADIYVFDEAGSDNKEVINKVFAELERQDNLMSNYKETSPLSEINRSAAKGLINSDPELLHVIERSIFYSSLTEGAFDITILPVVKKWGFYDEKIKGIIPFAKEIDAILPAVSYKNVVLDRLNNSISFKNKMTQIDLGAIGKGYAIDMAVEILNKNKVDSAIINFGGNIYVMGEPPIAESSKVWIQHPRISGGFVGYLNVKDMAISTSGDYEKNFIVDGIRYSHIFNPKTGQPINNSVASVTVVADSAIEADALSTGIFVMGLEKGLALVNKLPNVQTIILYEDNDNTIKYKMSEGMEKLFKPLNSDPANNKLVSF